MTKKSKNKNSEMARVLSTSSTGETPKKNMCDICEKTPVKFDGQVCAICIDAIQIKDYYY